MDLIVKSVCHRGISASRPRNMYWMFYDEFSFYSHALQRMDTPHLNIFVNFLASNVSGYLIFS